MRSDSRGARVSFETLPYEQCTEEIIAFRNSQRETQRDNHYFAWRYAGKPSEYGAHVTFARDAAGAPVASASAISHDFHLGDVSGAVSIVGDIAVTTAYRGHGIASRLLSELRKASLERGLRGCFVLPNADVVGALARAGWTQVAVIARFVSPLSVKGRLGRKFGPLGRLAGELADVFLRAADGRAPVRSGRPYTYSEAMNFGAAYDELWERLPKSGRFLARRSREYLQWRFTRKPSAGYRILEQRRGADLAGYVVYRTIGGLATIEDFLVTDEAASVALGRSFVAAVRDGREAETIQARFVADTPFAVPWRRGTFVKRPDFQFVMWADAEPRADSSRSASWFVTPADKDV